MPRLSFKIAYPIIIAGLFVMVSFIALNYQDLSWGFYVVFALLAIYIFLFGFAIGQNLTAPIKKLLEKADNLGKGDLKSRFYSESKDELGELGRAFNRIADKLEESTSENENTRKTVNIKVKAETQALEETINALEQKVQNRTLEVQKMEKDLENFKEYSKTRDAESADLKNQIQLLKDRLDKNGGSSKKNKSADKDKIEKKDSSPDDDLTPNNLPVDGNES